MSSKRAQFYADQRKRRADRQSVARAQYRTSTALGMSAAQVRQVIRNSGETKYFDTGMNVAVSWTGTTWASSTVACDNYVNSSGTAAAYTDSALIPTANGSGYGQVAGNRYNLKKLRVRGAVGYAGAFEDQANVGQPIQVRIMLIHDTQPNGAQALGSDIMQDIGAAAENLYSFKRVSNTSGRFRIIKDKFCCLQPATSGTDGTNTQSNSHTSEMFSFQYVPKTPIRVNIKSGNATPTVAGLVDNNFFLLVAGVNQTTSAVAAIGVYAASRAYYTDA